MIPPCASLTLRFDLSELEHLSAWLYAMGASLKLPESVVWNLEVCAHEAVTNIIDYSPEEAKDGSIGLALAVDGNAVSLSIRDQAQAFNPLDVPAPNLPTSLEEASVGGLGIHLIRNLMDECFYRRQNGSNELVMKALLPEHWTDRTLTRNAA
jgi:anti-sigma regulatory factor (Ser/Thr protein kinase)